MVAFYAISLLATKNKTYAYVDVFHVTAEKKEVKQQFRLFCEECVEDVYLKFKIQVNFVLHNGPHKFDW